MSRTHAMQRLAELLRSVAPAGRGLLQRQCACGQHTGGAHTCPACRTRGSAPPIVQAVLETPGQPLDAPTRAALEPRLGHDFARVRVHTDAPAAASARAVGARAYTVGAQIAFGAGEYQPATAAGQQLLAHELTHVVQQQGQPAALQRRPIGPELEDDPLEREADEIGRGIGKRPPRFPRPYRESARGLPPPPAARVEDTTQPVLDEDREKFDELRNFIRPLPAKIRALIAKGSATEPWLRADNANLQSVLRVLDQLVADLQAESFAVRFEQPANTEKAASYDYINNQMLLRPFDSRDVMLSVAISVVHEYTHILQDRAAEAAFAQQRAPQLSTREEDLQHEIEARREQVYFTELLGLLGYHLGGQAGFDERISSGGFMRTFERERTGVTPEEREAATGEIRSKIERAYAGQLERNASFKSYVVELNPHNHALLHWDLPGRDSPVDLGQLPMTLADAGKLNAHVWRLLRAQPDYTELFTSAPGQRYNAVVFFIVYQDRKVSQFGINAPTQ